MAADEPPPGQELVLPEIGAKKHGFEKISDLISPKTELEKPSDGNEK